MSTAILMCVLFFAKVVDNALSTTKTILVQRNHSILAGIALAASNFIYLCITKNVVNSDSYLALIVVSLASGVGCCMAVAVSSRLSKEKTYVNVIMSDDKEKMQAFRDFLAQHHITNTATDSYTLDWTTKSITVTAFAETNAHSRLINNYIEEHNLKCKRTVTLLTCSVSFRTMKSWPTSLADCTCPSMRSLSSNRTKSDFGISPMFWMTSSRHPRCHRQTTTKRWKRYWLSGGSGIYADSDRSPCGVQQAACRPVQGR